MREEQFSNIFLRPLYKDKIPLDKIDKNIYHEIIDLSDRFCIPSHVLNNFSYDKQIKNPLIQNLQSQVNIANLKKLINQTELLKISKLYNENNINHVFLKGSAINMLSNEYVRHSRDIDILVSKRSLTKAYSLLKQIGYNYHDPLVSDNCNYINHSHHLPVLSNGNGAFVEIHHRITKKLIYEQCPLTKLMLNHNSEIVMNNATIRIPDKNHLIAHIVYHAAFHHKFDLGPIFLYDINFLKGKITNNKDLKDLLISMKAYEFFKEFKDYLDNKKLKDSFNLYELSNLKMDNKRKPKKFNYLLFTKKGRLKLRDIIIDRFKNNEDSFQTSKYSIKFYLILFIQLKNYISRSSKI